MFIDFSICSQWHFIYKWKLIRHHVRWNIICCIFSQYVLICVSIRCYKKHLFDCHIMFYQYRNSIVHTIAGIKATLYLTKFYSMTSYLYLGIQSSKKFYLVISIISTHIACFIDPFSIWQCNKRCIGFFLVIQIALCKSDTAYTDFPFYSHWTYIQILIHYIHFLIE